MEKVKSFIQNEILSTLKGDIIGGISVAFVALPLALSFGVLSGAGAAAGVYGAICTGILASMFGGTKAQISGPTGAMTVVLVSMAEKYGLEGLVASMIVAGIFEIIMGLLKLGKYIRLIPKPVMVGFTNGIGMLIFINQFKYFEMSPLLCSIAIVMMLILNVFLLIVGCFMEPISAITILMPLLNPLIQAMGINPVHFGVVMVLNLMIGLLTPPFGMVLFVISRIGDISIIRLTKALIPWIGALLFTLLILSLFPQISLFLPKALGML